MARTFAPLTSLTWNGAAMFAREKKLPTPFVVTFVTTPFASVTTTVTVDPSAVDGGVDRGGGCIVGRHAPTTHFRQAAGGEALAGAAAARCGDRRSNQPPEHHRKRGTAPVRRAEENTSSQNAE